MKLRGALAGIGLAASCSSFAIDLYEVHGLEDFGKGSRGRHITSLNRGLSVAVGDVNNDQLVQSAAIWMDIDRQTGGSLTLLPTPDASQPSTAASFVDILDGRYVAVGQWKDLGGVPRASVWVNSHLAPGSFMGVQLPNVLNSTGSEALDVARLRNGGAAVCGSDWPLVDWKAALWLVQPNGNITELLLPTPAGSGWSIAQSLSDELLNQGLVIVGKVQQGPGGPWRACVWRLNLATMNIQFRYMSNTTLESYVYRLDPHAQFAVGWKVDEGVDHATLWGMRNGFPQFTLDERSRLYGVNIGGYAVGWLYDAMGVRQGLMTHVSYVKDQLFEYADLLEDQSTWSDYFHLLCVAEHGQTTGCSYSSDYPGGANVMRAMVGLPTDDHGFDQVETLRGKQIAGGLPNLLRYETEVTDYRAGGGQVFLEATCLSLPEDFTGLSLRADLAISGSPVSCRVLAYDRIQRRYVDTGQTASFTQTNPGHTFGWATFPSSWMLADGSVRFLLAFRTPGNRDVLSVDRLNLTSQP